MIAASPALALTAMINWDLLALGLRRRRSSGPGRRGARSSTGIFIGLGAATKLYPLFFLGPLLILCLRERQLAAWFKTVGGRGWSTWTVVNVPIYLWSPDAYMWFWKFNADRGPDFGSLWLVLSNYGHTASRTSINIDHLGRASAPPAWAIARARAASRPAGRGCRSCCSSSWSRSCWSTRSTRRST